MHKKDTRKYTNDYEELKEVIKEYSSTLKKAQSQKRLDNYHKLYLANLETRVNKSREKQCRKISNIIEPGSFATTKYDILSVLYQNRQNTLEISLPTTLYLGKDVKFIVKGHSELIFSTQKNINSYFLRDLSSNSKLPICLFKPKNSRMVLFYSFASVQKHLSENCTNFGYYQYFIAPSGQYSSILLAHITKTKSIKSYIIKNKKSIHPKETLKVSQTSSIISNEKSEILLSKYILDIIKKQGPVNRMNRQATFAFPNNDFDTNSDNEENSENPFLGSKGMKLLEDLRRRTSSVDNPRLSNEFLSVDIEDKLDIYLVNMQNSKAITPYALRTGVPEVDIMSKSIFSLVSTHMKKDSKQEVDEMTLLFIRDSMKRWYFLKVKAIKMKKPIIKQPKAMYTPTFIDESFCSPFTSKKSMALNKSSIGGYIVVTQPKEIKKQFIRVRSISDIKAKSFTEKQRLKKNKRIVINLNEHINSTVDNYDDMMGKIRFKINQSQRFDVKYNAECFWKEYSVKVHKNIIQSSIAKFFAKSTSENFHSISKAMMRVFCFNTDQRFRDYLKKVHNHLNITVKDFEIYKNIFLTGLDDYSIESKDIEAISAAFSSLKHLIVINSS